MADLSKRLEALELKKDSKVVDEWRELVYRNLTVDELRHIINAAQRTGDNLGLIDDPAWREANLSQEEQAALARWAELTLQAGLATA